MPPIAEIVQDFLYGVTAFTLLMMIVVLFPKPRLPFRKRT